MVGGVENQVHIHVFGVEEHVLVHVFGVEKHIHVHVFGVEKHVLANKSRAPATSYEELAEFENDKMEMPPAEIVDTRLNLFRGLMFGSWGENFHPFNGVSGGARWATAHSLSSFCHNGPPP
jgi:hypothetical protein